MGSLFSSTPTEPKKSNENKRRNKNLENLYRKFPNENRNKISKQYNNSIKLERLKEKIITHYSQVKKIPYKSIKFFRIRIKSIIKDLERRYKISNPPIKKTDEEIYNYLNNLYFIKGINLESYIYNPTNNKKKSVINNKYSVNTSSLQKNPNLEDVH